MAPLGIFTRDHPAGGGVGRSQSNAPDRVATCDERSVVALVLRTLSPATEELLLALQAHATVASASAASPSAARLPVSFTSLALFVVVEVRFV